MNERIEELIGQCIDQRWTVTGPMFDKEKFAELIVRECLDITDAHKKVFQTHQDKAFIEYIKQSVKTHFGVEE